LFSFSFVAKTFQLFLRYPSTIPSVRLGFAAAADRIDELRRREWLTNPVSIRYAYGFRICLNQNDILGCCPSIGITGIHELHVTELFRKILRKGMVVVDVGANVGWYSLLAAVGEAGTVVAFEPEPHNFALLRSSIEMNGFAKRVIAIPECVFDKDGETTLHLDSDNMGGHSIVHAERPSGVLKVPMTRLDTILPSMGIKRVNLLKVDVEGAEKQVIDGLGKLLQDIDHIIMEWNPDAWEGQSSVLHRLLETFEVYQIIRSPLLTRRITGDHLPKLGKCDLYLHSVF
jgi:FkbM family methyltransferase